MVLMMIIPRGFSIKHPVFIILEKCIVCNVGGLGSSSFESGIVLYFTPTYTYYMKKLIMQGMQQTLENSSFDVKRTREMTNLTIFHSIQSIRLLLLLIGFKTYTTMLPKIGVSIPMNMLGLHKFSLQATMDHHGPSMHPGHYTTSINCCKATFYCKDSKITEFEMIDTKNSSAAFVAIYILI